MALFQWSHLPWKIFNDPFQQWKDMPTFLGIEFMSFFLVSISLFHAIQNDRNHLLVWIASFITGSANDIFFMALPMVDNFWQAQATIMLTPRLPLYICCIYNVFLYFSTISSWRLSFENAWPEAAITGVLALLIYYPYDYIGVKHLWWTWHTTDPTIINRIMGVPIGSSLWILTFSASFSFVLYHIRGTFQMNFAITILFSALVTTPLMMLVMSGLQFVSMEKQGIPSISGFNVCLFAYIALIIINSTLLIDTRNSFKWIEHRCFTRYDVLLGGALLIYYTFLVIAGNFGNPQLYRSNGIHQSLGPCNISVIDFMGLTRDKYVCLADLPSEWNFNCLQPQEMPSDPPDIIDWYTICGSPHTDESQWKIYLNIFCLVSALTYTLILIALTVLTKSRIVKKKTK